MQGDWKRIADFLFEVGMLRKTPRSGYQFLGSGSENVAEHSFRTTVIGYVLAQLSDLDVFKTVLLCLFHDLHEARIGDFNYVNRIYNSCAPKAALADALQGTGLQVQVLGLHDEFEAAESPEARLAHDADQIDLILNLKQEWDLGNPYAAKWLECALRRLRTEQGQALAASISQTEHTDWWFKTRDHSWWTQGNGQQEPD